MASVTCWLSAAGQVTTGLRDSNTAGFMASVTCGLTAQNRNHRQTPSLDSSMGLLNTYFHLSVQCPQNSVRVILDAVDTDANDRFLLVKIKQ